MANKNIFVRELHKDIYDKFEELFGVGNYYDLFSRVPWFLIKYPTKEERINILKSMEDNVSLAYSLTDDIDMNKWIDAYLLEEYDVEKTLELENISIQDYIDLYIDNKNIMAYLRLLLLMEGGLEIEERKDIVELGKSEINKMTKARKLIEQIERQKEGGIEEERITEPLKHEKGEQTIYIKRIVRTETEPRVKTAKRLIRQKPPKVSSELEYVGKVKDEDMIGKELRAVYKSKTEIPEWVDKLPDEFKKGYWNEYWKETKIKYIGNVEQLIDKNLELRTIGSYKIKVGPFGVSLPPVTPIVETKIYKGEPKIVELAKEKYGRITQKMMGGVDTNIFKMLKSKVSDNIRYKYKSILIDTLNSLTQKKKKEEEEEEKQVELPVQLESGEKSISPNTFMNIEKFIDYSWVSSYKHELIYFAYTEFLKEHDEYNIDQYMQWLFEKYNTDVEINKLNHYADDIYNTSLPEEANNDKLADLYMQWLFERYDFHIESTNLNISQYEGLLQQLQTTSKQKNIDVVNIILENLKNRENIRLTTKDIDNNKWIELKISPFMAVKFYIFDKYNITASIGSFMENLKTQQDSNFEKYLYKYLNDNLIMIDSSIIILKNKYKFDVDANTNEIEKLIEESRFRRDSFQEKLILKTYRNKLLSITDEISTALFLTRIPLKISYTDIEENIDKFILSNLSRIDEKIIKAGMISKKAKKIESVLGILKFNYPNFNSVRGLIKNMKLSKNRSLIDELIFVKLKEISNENLSKANILKYIKGLLIENVDRIPEHYIFLYDKLKIEKPELPSGSFTLRPKGAVYKEQDLANYVKQIIILNINQGKLYHFASSQKPETIVIFKTKILNYVTDQQLKNIRSELIAQASLILLRDRYDFTNLNSFSKSVEDNPGYTATYILNNLSDKVKFPEGNYSQDELVKNVYTLLLLMNDLSIENLWIVLNTENRKLLKYADSNFIGYVNWVEDLLKRTLILEYMLLKYDFSSWQKLYETMTTASNPTTLDKFIIEQIKDMSHIKEQYVNYTISNLISLNLKLFSNEEYQYIVDFMSTRGQSERILSLSKYINVPLIITQPEKPKPTPPQVMIIIETKNWEEDVKKYEESLYAQYKNSNYEYLNAGIKLIMFLSTDNEVGRGAHIFREKVKSGMYEVPALINVDLDHYIPELTMNKYLTDDNMFKALKYLYGTKNIMINNVLETILQEDIIRKYTNPLSVEYIMRDDDYVEQNMAEGRATYGADFSQRSHINVKFSNFLISPTLLSEPIALDISNSQLIVCRYDKKIKCYSKDQLVALIAISRLKGDKPQDPYGDGDLSQDLISQIEKKYEAEINDIMPSDKDIFTISEDISLLPISEINTNGVNIKQGKINAFNGRRIGKWIFRYGNGNEKIVGNYNRYGERIGEWKEYYDNNKIHKVNLYDDQGKMNGKWIEYLILGDIIAYGEYDHDIKIGEWAIFDTNIIYKGTYKNDKKVGEWRSYYFSINDFYGLKLSKPGEVVGGVQRSIENYVDGLKNGNWELYYNNHIFHVIGQYVNDKKQGTWLTYVRSTAGGYSNNILYSKKEYDNGNKVGEWINYVRGKIYEKIMYKNNEMDGQYVSYYNSDKIITTGIYENGLKEGKWERYDEFGRLIEDGFYTEGLKNGEWIAYLYYPEKKERKERTRIYVNGELDVNLTKVKIYTTKTKREWEQLERGEEGSLNIEPILLSDVEESLKFDTVFPQFDKSLEEYGEEFAPEWKSEGTRSTNVESEQEELEDKTESGSERSEGEQSEGESGSERSGGEFKDVSFD